MALITKGEGGGSDFELIPEDTHLARATLVVDLGIQETMYGNKEQVYFGFEVPGVRVKWSDKDGKEHEGPALIGKIYTNSIHPDSNLCKDLTSWRGKSFTDEERQGFDLFNVLGAPCLISVTHKEAKNGKTYQNIASIMRVPQGMEVPKAESELIGYTPSDSEKIGNLDKLPKWLKEKCEKGHGAAASSLGSGFQTDVASGNKPQAETYSEDAGFEDDIPF